MSNQIRRHLAAGVVLTLAVVLAVAAAAEEHASDPDPRLPVKPYGLRQLRYDAQYLVHRPFRSERRGRAKLLTVAGTTLALYLAREGIREFVDDHRSDGATRLANGARDVFGKGAFAPTLALIAYGASFATDNEREKETAFLLLESMAYSSLMAASGSFVLAAERPELGDSVRCFESDGRGISLDVALAASVIPTLRRQYLRIRPEDDKLRRFWKRSLTGVLWAGAVLTAYQRVDADKHWAPDVYLGMVTGLSIGRTLNAAHDEVRTQEASLSLGLVPRGVGFTVHYRLSR